MDRGYAPSRGDIVWLSFDPQVGHEQMGIRPAVTISPLQYNRKVGLGIFCPITSHVKGYPFEVSIPEGLPVSGVILCDEVKNLDWQARNARFACSLPEAVMAEVLGRLGTLIV